MPVRTTSSPTSSSSMAAYIRVISQHAQDIQELQMILFVLPARHEMFEDLFTVQLGRPCLPAIWRLLLSSLAFPANEMKKCMICMPIREFY